MEENKNTQNIKENNISEESAAESLPEVADETVSDGGESVGEVEAAKPKSKAFIAYISLFVIFIAAAVIALVSFGIYANDLVNGDSGAGIVNYCVEISAAYIK